MTFPNRIQKNGMAFIQHNTQYNGKGNAHSAYTSFRETEITYETLITCVYLLASMYNLQLIRMRIKPNVAKNAPSHRPKFISSNMVSVIFVDDLLLLRLIEN